MGTAITLCSLFVSHMVHIISPPPPPFIFELKAIFVVDVGGGVVCTQF